MHEDDARLDATMERLLRSARRIAVLGASPREDRPAFRVPRYLVRHGYEVLPVNARYAGQELHERTVAGVLTELDGAVDIVDVFRKAEDVPGHLDEILAMRPLPGAVWLQLGIRNDEAAARLREAGITVVQDRCIKIEHGRLLGARSETGAG